MNRLSIACLVAIVATVNARSFLLPTGQGFGPGMSGFVPGGMGKPAYPNTRPIVVSPVETEEELVSEEEAPLPCNPNVIGVVVHPEESVEEEQPQRPGGTFYPIIINRPSVVPAGPIQTRPSVVPAGPTQTRPSITPTGPAVITRPLVPRPELVRPSVVRPAEPEVPQPCGQQQQEEEEEVVVVEQGRPQTRPQVLPPVSVINTRPVLRPENREPVAVVVEADGNLRPVYDWIR